MPRIEIWIGKDGKNIIVEGQQFEGPICEEKLKPFADALGGATHEEHKAAYYEGNTTKEGLLE